MSKSLRQVAEDVQGTYDSKQNRGQYYQAWAGHLDGSTVYNTAHDGYIFARLGSEKGHMIEVFAGSALIGYNKALLVTHPPYRLRDWVIVDNPEGLYTPTNPPDDNNGGVPPSGGSVGIHAAQHDIWGGDTDWIQGQRLLPLLVWETVPASLNVNVTSGWYPYSDGGNYYAGGQVDLSTFVPGTTGKACWALVYIEGSSNTAKAVGSAIFNDSVNDYPGLDSLLSLFPPGSVPLAAVLLPYGLATIKTSRTERRIYDMRQMVSAFQYVPSAIAAGVLYVVRTLDSIYLATAPTVTGGVDTPITSALGNGASGIIVASARQKPDQLRLTELTAGIWNLSLKAKAGINANVTLFWKFYRVQPDGTTTLLGTSAISSALTTSDAVYALSILVATSPLGWGLSDVLKIEIRANATSADTVTVELGDDRPRLTFPVPNAGNSLALGDGHLFIGSAAGVATDQALGGDATLTNAGILTVGAKKIGAAKVALADAKLLIGGADGAAHEQLLSGDATLANTGVLTLPTVMTAGTYGDSTHIVRLTLDAKGRATAAELVSIAHGTHTHAHARFAATAGQSVFTLPTSATLIDYVALNGLLEDFNAYSLTDSGATVTLNNALTSDTLIMVSYQEA